jgi:anti-anti-sigma factor
MTSAINKILSSFSPIQDNTTVVRLSETAYASLDTAKLAHARQVLLREAETIERPVLVVDLSAVQFFGARFAGLLVSTWDLLRRRNRRLVLCGLTPYCAGMIKDLSLDRLFEIRPRQQVAPDESGDRDANEIGNGSIPGVRIEKTDVAWDPRMERWEYFDGDGCPIQTVIVPRPH